MKAVDLAPVVVVWAAALWHGHKLVRHAMWERCLSIGLFTTAAYLTIRLEPVAQRIADLSGEPNLPVLLQHILAICSSGAWLEWALLLRAPAERVQLFLTRDLLGWVTMIGLVVTWWRVPDNVDVEFFAGAGRSPAAALHELVFIVYLTVAGLVAARVFWRKVAMAKSASFAWGLRLLATAFTLTPGYGAARLIDLAVYATGRTVPSEALGPARVLSRALGGISIALIVAGISVPGTVVVRRMWIVARRLRALRPLWEMVVPAIPSIGLGTSLGRHPARMSEDLDLTLIRRATEIRDALFALRCHGDPKLWGHIHSDLHGRGLTGPDLEAATTACWATLAATALAHGDRPHLAVPLPPRSAVELDVEMRQLLHVEAARNWPQSVACVAAVGTRQ